MILLFLCIVTTDGRLAAGNLDAQIAGFERAGHIEEEIPLLLERAQLRGRPADYERALRLAEKSKNPLLGARVHTALHQFKKARADFAHAKQPVSADLLEAMGDEDRALPLREAEARARPNFSTLGALASLYGRLGRLDEAARKFAEARASYRDVSPFAVAWLELQEGLMNERAGRLASARERYQAAVDRLPEYAPAIGHLAGVLAALGEKPQALRLLRPLAEAMDDPEYAAEYVALEDDAQLRARAAARYDQLLARFPEAYADHAARFFTGKRAVELARKNLANRHSDDAWQLLIETLPKHEACRAADDALKTRHGAALKLAAARAYLACGQKLKAEAASQ